MRDEKDLKLALRWGKGGSKYQLLEQIFFIHPRQNFCLKEFTKTGKLYFEKSMTTTLRLVHTHCLTTAIMAATAAILPVIQLSFKFRMWSRILTG